MKLCISLVSFLIFQTPQETHSCGGNRIIINSARNCVENPIIKLPDNYSFILHDDCMLEIVGCAEITKRFETAEGTCFIRRDPFPIVEAAYDFCEILEMADLPIFRSVLNIFHLPKKCPVDQMVVCNTADHKIDLTPFKMIFQRALKAYFYRFEFTHDVGRSCVEFNITVHKN